MADSGIASRSPELAAAISAADVATQRRLALAATEYAFFLSPFKDGAQEAVAALRKGGFGDSPLKRWLEVESDKAWAHSADASEAGDDAQALALNTYRHALGTACSALDEDAEAAAIEAVYEARFAQRPKGEFDEMVKAILAGGDSG
jgi:hypothetical protein